MYFNLLRKMTKNKIQRQRIQICRLLYLHPFQLGKFHHGFETASLKCWLFMSLKYFLTKLLLYFGLLSFHNTHLCPSLNFPLDILIQCFACDDIHFGCAPIPLLVKQHDNTMLPSPKFTDKISFYSLKVPYFPQNIPMVIMTKLFRST